MVEGPGTSPCFLYSRFVPLAGLVVGRAVLASYPLGCPDSSV
jgi:hypothetical protein